MPYILKRSVGALTHSSRVILVALTALAFALGILPSFAVPRLIGDLDSDGQATVLDIVRLMNFLNGSVSIPATPGTELSDLSPYGPLPAIYADINEDGVLDSKDVELLELAIFGANPLPDPTAPPVLPSFPPSTNGASLVLTGTTQTNRSLLVVGDFTIIRTNTGPGSDFNIRFPLASNRLNRIFVSSSSDKFGPGTPQVIEIVQDSEPPNLFIDFPTASSEIITNVITVAGRVGDMLSGYRGLKVSVTNLTVLTNTSTEAQALRPFAGGEAIVDVGIGNNGTFARTDLPVLLGTNVIEATAIDVLGNKRVRTTSVVRSDPTGKPRMLVLSGDGQATNVHLRLAEPLRVQLLKADGTPFARKWVTFEVTRSNGRLISSFADTNAGSLRYQVETDIQGIASAWLALGSDAGCGNNRVCASSADITGCGYFCASAYPAPASQINIGWGNNQKVEAGGQAAETLRAWVNDSCNGVPNVAVTFAVTQGGGKVRVAGTQDPWASIVRVRTGITGHAAVDFQAGPAGGANQVEANFLANRFLPATFTIYGVERDLAKPTSFSGLVLDNTSRPIGGAQCLLTVNGTDYRGITDVQGRFRFDGIEAGRGHLYVNGQTATTIFTNQIRKGSFPGLSYMHTIVPNADNSLATPVLLPRLNTNNIRSYYGTNDLVLTCEGMEGLKMRVKAGSLKRLVDGTIPVPGQEIPISLNQVHHDQVPMPIPDGASPPFAWTLQPGGAVFDPPIEIEYPNMSGLPAGNIAYFLSFNHDTERFEIVSSGHVKPDGATIVTDTGSGLTLSGWGCNCPPYSVTGECNCSNDPSVLSRIRQFRRQEEEVFRELLEVNSQALERISLAMQKVAETAPALIQLGLKIAEAAKECRDDYGCPRPPLGCLLCVPLFVDLLQEVAEAAEPTADALVLLGEASILEAKLVALNAKLLGLVGLRATLCLPLFIEEQSSDFSASLLSLQNSIDRQRGIIKDSIEVKLQSLERELKDYVNCLTDPSGISCFPESLLPLPQAGNDVDFQFSVERIALQLTNQVTALGEVQAMIVSVSSSTQSSFSALRSAFWNENWTFSVGGQNATGLSEGLLVIENLSSPDLFGADGPGSRPDFIGDDYVRVIGHSSTGGTNRYAFSDFFQIRQGQTVTIGDLTFTDVPPRKPELLFAKPVLPTLTRIGQSTQLRVLARFADGSTNDVSARTAWTSYRLSNPDIVTVDKDGVVTAKGSGTAFLTAVNEGVAAVTQIDVSPGDPLTSITGYLQTPDGRPVAGATVRLGGGAATTTTDSNGRFLIEGAATRLGPTNLVAYRIEQGFVFAAKSTFTLVPGGISDAGMLIADGQCATCADQDKDGLPDDLEVALRTSPINRDSDGDGLTDFFELIWSRTDPLQRDTDRNTLADDREDPDGDGLNNLGEETARTDPWRYDTDGDLFDDASETAAQSNPLDAASTPLLTYFVSLPRAQVLAIGPTPSEVLEPGVHIAHPPLSILSPGLTGGATNIAIGVVVATPPTAILLPGLGLNGSTNLAVGTVVASPPAQIKIQGQ